MATLIDGVLMTMKQKISFNNKNAQSGKNFKRFLYQLIISFRYNLTVQL